MSDMELKPVMSVDDAAHYLGVSKKMVYKAIQSGDIAAFKLYRGARQWHITSDEIRRITTHETAGRSDI